MSQELFINVTDAEIRAALMGDTVLIDLIVERRGRASVVGNIYLGRVERVMNGMEAAFVDIGLSRSGFLGLDGGRRRNGEADIPVHEGEAVVVQITKDAIAGKGVQLSRRLTLPGRYLVYAPMQDRVMVSRQIGDEAERDRLTSLMADLADVLPFVGKSSEALRLMERAIALNPDHPDWYFRPYGIALFFEGVVHRLPDESRVARSLTSDEYTHALDTGRPSYGKLQTPSV